MIQTGILRHGTVSITSQSRRERAINRFAGITQSLTWPISLVFFNTLYRLNITGRDNFALVESPFIIVANHISFFDSFLFRLALGLRTPHLPLRFMAVERFDWKFLNFLSKLGIIKFIYSLFGVFTVVPGMGLRQNLSVAKEIISVGGNVVIYPEGRIFIAGGIGRFKHGAAVLAKETGVPIIPVAFKFGPRRGLRRSLSIVMGRPLRAEGSITVEGLTERMHSLVEDLWRGR